MDRNCAVGLSDCDPSNLSARFASRLNLVLDRLGYPGLPMARERALCLALSLEQGLATALMGGKQLPNWEVLLKLCALAGQQPSYFLDEVLNELPPQTRSIKALGSGEGLILRLPFCSSKLWADSSTEWTYLKSNREMGFGVLTGDYIVNCSISALNSETVSPSGLFLMNSNNRYGIYQCKEVTRTGVILFGSNEAIGSEELLVVPTGVLDSNSSSLRKAGIQFFGQIEAIVRGAKTFPIV